MNYQQALVAKRGGPEVIRFVEQKLIPPPAGQVISK
jgi:hypothetical protein